MPTYTYTCKDCGERLDVVRSFSDDPLTECPACGGTLRQVFKPAGIVFKGSGWHIKDYADSGAAPSATNGSGSNGSTSEGSSSSSEPSSSSGTTSETTSSSSSSSTGSSTSTGSGSSDS